MKIKTIRIAMMVFMFTAFSVGTASASWFSHTFHSVTETVSRTATTVATGTVHTANAVATGVTTAANDVGKFAKSHAKQICRFTVPKILDAMVGKRCKTVAAEFEGECTAEMGAETEGMAEPACVAGAVEIYSECRAEGKFAVRMVKPITNALCNKI